MTQQLDPLLLEVLEECARHAEQQDIDIGTRAGAAACYAANASNVLFGFEPLTHLELEQVGWPLPIKSWEPQIPRRDLVRAAAMLLLELRQLPAD